MISYLLPWYKKLDWFRLSLPHNAQVFSTNAEVVIAMDDPGEEKGLIDLVRQWPSIRFVVVVNDEAHDWRPPCKAINVALRNSTYRQVVIMSPESILCLPFSDFLTTRIAPHVTTGLLWNVEMLNPDGPVIADKLRCFQDLWAPANFGYGFIMAPAWVIEAVRGYDESRTSRNGDDDNIRLRLLRHGMPLVVDPDIRIFHPWHYSERSTDRDPTNAQPILENREWGRDFNRIAWDWKNIT